MGALLYLLLCSGYITQLVSAKKFLVTAPSIFHVGVEEKVSVQVGEGLLNKPVTCHLEQEVGRVLMSKRQTTQITEKGKIERLELQILPDKIANLPWASAQPPYLNLVCDVGEIKRRLARVLVSKHRGYIFIQTDQPIYNPTQKVQYRIFTLDHAMRPISEKIYVSLINPEGSTVKETLVSSVSGIYVKVFHIPDVSQPGVWKIKARYRDDESATIREFKVQKFVLPSFVVTIKPETDYLLVGTENFKFSIDVAYSYGKKINGGFHCRFGVRGEDIKEPNDIIFIKGLEETGPVRNGEAEITLKIAKIQEKLQPIKLEDLAQNGARFYIAATVTDTFSGEVQESEIFLPIVSQKYKVDLDRTRSHFIPKVPFDVNVVVHTPTGLPAKDVPVKISVSHTKEKSTTVKTDDEGIAFSVFNFDQSPQSISVEATVDGVKSTKNVAIATSSSNSFLLISVINKVLAPGQQLSVEFDLVNGQANDGYVYYLILSKGALIRSSSVIIGRKAIENLFLGPDMVPSFRLIGYYYNTNGEIIADSIWVDVKDECEGKVMLTQKKHQNYYHPAESIEFNIDVGDQQNAKVALLAVDKAIYALNAPNKLTLKQVFSSMQSYDLGCSYGGGGNTAAVFNDAGLTFISHSETVKSQMRIGFGCESGFRKQRRSIDLQKELAQKETEYPNAVLKKCCRHGLILLPMKLSCEERKERMNAGNECEEAFLKCCIFATQLREKKRQEELRNSFGRTASASDIENFFNNDIQYIRRSFPPSFEFDVFNVNGQHNTKQLILPDSITTWEIQAVSLSPSHGFCVAKPLDIRAFQELFIALRLPYSVRKNEQMAIVVVIYNYGKKERQLAVHMKQIDGLCSPGALSIDSYVNITLAGGSSETVTFSAVPLKEGEIPITIQLYDRKYELGVDAIQKTLLVMNEGVRMEQKYNELINLDGKSDKYINIDGGFPNGTIPDSAGNIFVKVEAYNRILTFKKDDGSYGAWKTHPTSNWLTALVVKVLSLVADCQLATTEDKEIVSQIEIRKSVKYIIEQQQKDGSFTDPNPVIHREMQGGIGGVEQDASLTAFIAIALKHSLPFLDQEIDSVTISIAQATSYLQSRVDELQRPFSLAITAYCLSFCLEVKKEALPAWERLKQKATIEGDCKVWLENEDIRLLNEKKQNLVPSTVALTVESTAYALLTALEHQDFEEAKLAACFLSSQENYEGGFKSTQDTIIALEALSEYALRLPPLPVDTVNAQFTSVKRNEKENLALNKNGEKVEKDLKRLLGSNIIAKFSGKGQAKVKVVKAFYVPETSTDCSQLAINVTVKGKVEYTTQVTENYDYDYNYDHSERREEEDFPRSAIEWFDARTRRRRNTQQSQNAHNILVYEVCISHSLERKLTGMGIADITLLSGFEPKTEDLDLLKDAEVPYISHYEFANGRVLLYFNKIYKGSECIAFEAIQRVPIGLLQPAPATFYDYYEPERRCTTFYSAPSRTKMVSALCSNEVCQCAERACFKEKRPSKSPSIAKEDRFRHVCFQPIADYGFMVTVNAVEDKKIFDFYYTTVTEVLKYTGDISVTEGKTRIFAKRKHCKSQLEVGNTYLIMGKDGSTTDLKGHMIYLLDSDTWVEHKPTPNKCKASNLKSYCKGFQAFRREYQVQGCSQ
ncbi:complement C4-B isoform X2 [Neoarius graeffei]|uniref:complement C4-B isoform X2 n=1 Tax=Neoarius graeffei TaxID=443677 RepID=UPI00298BCADE|nr:complement C4-B isoform X2 [Neoarius graeffei]